jgi:hypothetical protein
LGKLEPAFRNKVASGKKSETCDPGKETPMKIKSNMKSGTALWGK